MTTNESRISAKSIADSWLRACQAHERWLEDGAIPSEDLEVFASNETDQCPGLLPLAMDVVSTKLDMACFERLSCYASQVLEANRLLNLVSRRDPEAQILTNIMDALPLALIWEHVSRETELRESPCFVLDAGSGSGVPGIPMVFAIEAMIGKAPPLLLVESRGRKADFLTEAINMLDLERAEVWNGRLESPELVTWLEESGWPTPGLLITRGLGSVSQTLQWCRALAREESLSSMLLVKGTKGIRREWDEEGSRWQRSIWKQATLHTFVGEDRQFCALEGFRPLDTHDSA